MLRGRNIACNLRHSKKCMQFGIDDLTATALHHAASASTGGDFDTAFAGFINQRVGALLVGNDALLLSRREQLVALATRHGPPAIYFFREFVAPAA
jgi:hypothetical protein